MVNKKKAKRAGISCFLNPNKRRKLTYRCKKGDDILAADEKIPGEFGEIQVVGKGNVVHWVDQNQRDLGWFGANFLGDCKISSEKTGRKKVLRCGGL